MQRLIESVRVVSVMMVVAGQLGCAPEQEREPDEDEPVEVVPLTPRHLESVTSSDQTLSSARDHHVSFAFEVDGASQLHVLGGAFHKSEPIFTVETATVATDGTLSSLRESPIPTSALSIGAALASTPTVAIASGGMRETAGSIDNSARVDVIVGTADGTLTFLPGPDLPFPSFHGSAVVVAGRVYHFGGVVDVDVSDNTDRVVSAALAADGTLSAWREEAPLPYTLSHHGIVADGDSIIIVGGITGSSIDGEVHDEVLRVPVLADGRLGEFTQVSTLPYPLSVPATALVDGSLYAIGGVIGNATVSNEVLQADVDGDSVSEFLTIDVLPDARMHVHQAPVVGDHFYLAGGASIVQGSHASHDTIFVGTFAR